MARSLRSLLLLLQAPSVVLLQATITVCTGGACAENGGADLLLSATHALAACDPKLTVREASCTGACPADSAMVCPSRGREEPYEAVGSTIETAIASASDLIAAAGSKVSKGLPEAFMHAIEADVAEAAGEVGVALAGYSAAIDALPVSVFDPSQEPPGPEPLAWDASFWREDCFSSVLAFKESSAHFEFGDCGVGDECVVLIDCIVSADEPPTLTGLWEGGGGGGGSGQFEITMSDDGRRFVGTISDDAEGTTKEWSGMRTTGRGARRTRRGEAAPARVSWIQGALLGRARVRLASGDAAGAVDDARAATKLACRDWSSWKALAVALEANGDEEGAKAARKEEQWLGAIC
jgi:hypothetical protein